MRISPATAEDEDEIAALWRRTGLTRPWNDARADFQRAQASEQATVLVAREQSAILGSVMVGDDGHRGWLYYLAVHEAHRDHGLGAALVRSAEVWLRERGQTRVRLMVRHGNDAVNGFYAALGYEDQECRVLGRVLT
jgi:ribosomal protein S18 acetylase RimI-like enzyme